MTNIYKRGPLMSINDTYKAFFDVLKLNSLEELVKTAKSVFGLPLVLHDENSRLLYQYPQKPLGDKIWDTFLNHKSMDTAIMQDYQARFLSDKPVDFSPFYFCPDDPDESKYIFGQVYSNNKNHGYFTIYMFDNPLDKDDIERAKIFSEALGMIFSHRNSTSKVSLNASLYDVLSGEKGEIARSQSLSNLIRDTKGSYILMVKPIGSKTDQRTYATMSVRVMPKNYSNIVMTIFKDCLVILYYGIKSKNYIESEYKKIADIDNFLKASGAGIGVSSLFDDIFTINKHFEQAYMTALCSPEHIEFYERIAPEPVFQYAAHYGNAEAFIHPALNTIYKYDSLNNTDYFETLRTYSLLMHNKELSASELCIHRNTLLYRLNRIREIFDLPYEDPHVALHLLNSFQLWDVLNK
ncbi:MAG: helix-turn-helix domain-containing protein [Firmicutes bacterium]|nr:helix-turn-helix domain-containing protein [Bacillota bacterium]